MRLLVSILIIVWASFGQAGTRDPATPDAQYVEFGKSFPWVAQLSNTIENCPKCEKSHQQRASAVIIRPHWALTAAHVVKDAKDNVIILDGKARPVAAVIAHRDFKEENVGFHDIALCYCPDDFGLKRYLSLYTKTDEVGKAVTIAGWGAHGTFVTGAKEFDGNRRAGHNRISNEFSAVLICTPGNPKKFPLEFMIAPGDSGGGMFIGNELAGINSFLLATDSAADGTYSDESAFTRVSLYADWVETEIKKHENALFGRATLNVELP